MVGKVKVSSPPSRSTIYRARVRHGLVAARKRRRLDYKRWQREELMELWQLDVTGSVFLADGTDVHRLARVALRAERMMLPLQRGQYSPSQ
jgi:hypothetical protein